MSPILRAKDTRRILRAKDVANGRTKVTMEEALDLMADLLLILDDFPTHPFFVKVMDPEDEYNYDSYFMAPWSLSTSEKLARALDTLAQKHGVQFLPIVASEPGQAGVTVEGTPAERAYKAAREIIFELRNQFAENSAIILRQD